MKKKFSIVKNFIYFLAFSLILIAGSIYAFVSNLRWSIEFTGGIKMTVAGEHKIDVEDFENTFKQDKLTLKYVYNQ